MLAAMIPSSATELEIAGRLALAGLSGVAVGIEREWSGHASGPHARFAGVRTFLLLGLVGGMSGAMAAAGWAALAVTLTGGAAVLAVVAYVVASEQTADRDGTTETAALLVLSTGALCGLGYGRVGSGIAVVAALALAEKSRIQNLVTRIGDIELRAALRFAVLALVVLPLLPEGPYGPFDAIRPRELWSIVLLFSGLNFLGYLARRTVGPEPGYGITGLLGGLVSSTAVTLSFSRESRSSPKYAVSLALGVLAACTVVIPRVFAITLALSLRWPSIWYGMRSPHAGRQCDRRLGVAAEPRGNGTYRPAGAESAPFGNGHPDGRGIPVGAPRHPLRPAALGGSRRAGLCRGCWPDGHGRADLFDGSTRCQRRRRPCRQGHRGGNPRQHAGQTEPGPRTRSTAVQEGSRPTALWHWGRRSSRHS